MAFNYSPAFGFLHVSGLPSAITVNVNPSTDDFLMLISDLNGTPDIDNFLYSQTAVSSANSFKADGGILKISYNAIPLPATLPLMLGALALGAGLRRRG